MGGVCYRPNYEQHFIEIAFLAISSMEQVKVLIKFFLSIFLGIWYEINEQIEGSLQE